MHGHSRQADEVDVFVEIYGFNVFIGYCYLNFRWSEGGNSSEAQTGKPVRFDIFGGLHKDIVFWCGIDESYFQCIYLLYNRWQARYILDL